MLQNPSAHQQCGCHLGERMMVQRQFQVYAASSTSVIGAPYIVSAATSCAPSRLANPGVVSNELYNPDRNATAVAGALLEDAIQEGRD